MKRDLANERRHYLKASLGMAAAMLVASCGSRTDSGETLASDIESVINAQTISSMGTLAYDNECLGNNVPLPPKWGVNKFGDGNNGTWKDNMSYGGAFFGIDGGHVYYARSTSPPGICVINAHFGGGGTCGMFDLICQGTNGKACFWEASLSPTPPAVGIDLVPTTQVPTGPPLKGGTDLAKGHPAKIDCVTCHAGENAFIARLQNGVLNLGSLWNPTSGNWMDPLVTDASIQNAMPGTTQFTHYPVSTSGCTNSTCHAPGGLGGRFAQFAKYPSNSSDPDYCDLIARVTNRPGTESGMPPTSTCDRDLDCALQKDPFVKAIMASCPENGVYVAMSSSWSPVGLAASGTGGIWPGAYDHFVADRFLPPPTSSQAMARGNNRFTGGQFQGWGLDNVNGQIPTNWRATAWVKSNAGNGNEYTIAATDNAGTVWEYSQHGRVNVTAGWGITAQGSPLGFRRHDGNQSIVFRGTIPGDATNHIFEALWSGSAWSIVQLPDQGADGDPIAYARGQSSSVIYKCGTLLCELRLAGGQWWFRDFKTLLPNAKPLKVRADGDGYGSTMPAAIWFGGFNPPQGNIFYTATDGVHVIKDDADPWFNGPVTESLTVADSTVASSPSVYHNDSFFASEGDQYGADAIVYRAGSGTSGKIIELVETGTGARSWNRIERYSAQPNEILSDDVASYLSIGPWANTILFRNTAHALKQGRFNWTSGTYVFSTIY